MKNPGVVMFDDIKEVLAGTIFVIVFIMVLGAIASIPGAPPEAKNIAEQTSNSITWFWIFVIGLPSIGVLIAFIIWIKKKFDENNSYNL